jgi:hypothetical protein
MTASGTGPQRIGRSVLALAAGFVVVVVASLGTDAVLHATGVFPPWGQPMSDARFALATAYRSAYAIVGSGLTAALAPRRPMAHALLGGGIGMAIATVGAAATWNLGPEFGPHWYPLSLVVTALPCAWLGASIVSRREA